MYLEMSNNVIRKEQFKMNVTKKSKLLTPLPLDTPQKVKNSDLKIIQPLV